ncbi:threonine/serine exporter family protein [Corynebacterium sp. 4HC-13]|uniref:Amino acid export carrier protein n=2 Tax=Corynebacterium anserum TaxID=2684406 RepID=A0A7G7YQU1_9CORY|nr:threonine/serine exporter family protein [Corynebacterium anserum]MBC2681244.1 threonine/serine exporter family protein [Corynebacterium anserum]QNH96861.1 amino acid export carrier protein [Corynebacterium anserum]
MAPPPSPLAPIDFTDTAKIHAVLNLAGRIGDLLLSAGTGNSDAKAQIRAITHAYGLHYTHVDITLNTITVYAYYDQKKNPASAFRVVHSLTTDFSRLVEVDQLIRSICRGAVSLEEAQRILFKIETSPLPYRNRYALLAWGFFAGAVALLLGGGWAVACVATITTIFTIFANAWLASKSLPLFFQNVIGGFVAVFPAGLAYRLADDFGFYLPPSLVVASCIVALLAGLTLVQALQDGVTGAPVTSSARFFETILSTGAIIAGIAVGIQFTTFVGLTLPPLDQNQAVGLLGSTSVRIISGAIATMFFCIACFTERQSMLVASTTALVASVAYYFILNTLDLGVLAAAAVAGLIVGFAGGVLSRRFQIPPQITAAAGITPFLPGLALYRGMSNILNDNFVTGLSNLALALGTATALAASVVLGEWIARRIRRPALPRMRGTVPTPRMTSTGRIRQPLHWRRQQKSSVRSLWQLDTQVADREAPLLNHDTSDHDHGTSHRVSPRYKEHSGSHPSGHEETKPTAAGATEEQRSGTAPEGEGEQA